MINLNGLDFAYEYDNLFQKTTFHSHLITLKKELLKINPDLLSNINDTKNSDDIVNSNQNWNNTNDKFNSYSDMETQRRCDEIK